MGNVALSSDTGASLLNYISGAGGDLPNNLVNLTTNGGPVKISLLPGTAVNNSYIECEEATTDPCILQIKRDGLVIFETEFFSEGNIYRLPAGAFNFLDTPSSGTYEYKVSYSVPSATALRILNVRLMAYEL